MRDRAHTPIALRGIDIFTFCVCLCIMAWHTLYVFLHLGFFFFYRIIWDDTAVALAAAALWYLIHTHTHIQRSIWPLWKQWYAYLCMRSSTNKIVVYFARNIMKIRLHAIMHTAQDYLRHFLSPHIVFSHLVKEYEPRWTISHLIITTIMCYPYPYNIYTYPIHIRGFSIKHFSFRSYQKKIRTIKVFFGISEWMETWMLCKSYISASSCMLFLLCTIAMSQAFHYFLFFFLSHVFSMMGILSMKNRFKWTPNR